MSDVTQAGVGNNPSAGGGISNAGSTDKTSPSYNSQKTHNPYSKDSIEQASQISDELIALLIGAGAPLLAVPDYNFMLRTGVVSSAQSLTGTTVDQQALIDFNAKKELHHIVMGMWDAFQDGLEKIAERSKEDLKAQEIKKREIEHDDLMLSRGSTGPKSATEYFEYISSLAVGNKERIAAETTSVSTDIKEVFNRWLSDPTNVNSTGGIGSSYADPLDYPSINFLAAAALGGIELLQGPKVGSELSVSPIADAMFAAGPNSGLPGDAQGAAALIAAMLYGGAITRANVETVLGAKQKNEPPQDLDFAVNFARGILAIVTTAAQRIQPEDNHATKQDKLIGLSLALIALNLLYRANYGGMTGDELAGLLSGKQTSWGSDIRDDVKKSLERLITAIMSYLPEDADERSGLLSGLMAYVDAKHSVDSMLDTTRQFKAYFADKGQVDDVLPSAINPA